MILVETVNVIPPASVANAWIKRELVIDRHTGDITEVRLYNPEGVMIVRSTMSDYRPATLPSDAEGKATGPRVPYMVTLDYPAQEMRVSMQFESVTVPERVNDAAFKTPDFEGQDLKVNRE